MSDKSIDDAYNLLHTLVSLDDTEASKSFIQENVETLSTLWKDHSSEPLHRVACAADFLEMVSLLDVREAELSRALGSALLNASELMEKEEIHAATKVLNDFIDTCTSASFRELAAIERDNLED